MIINPLGDRVYIKPEKKDEQSKGGILFAPDPEAKPYTNIGEIIAVGPDVTEVQKGQRVLFGQYSGTLIELNNEKYLIMREEHVECIIEG